jgi:hypothetical protein
VQEKPELVGDEAVATEAIRLHVELEILDPVFCLSSASCPLVLLGSLFEQILGLWASPGKTGIPPAT